MEWSDPSLVLFALENNVFLGRSGGCIFLLGTFLFPYGDRFRIVRDGVSDLCLCFLFKGSTWREWRTRALLLQVLLVR